MLAKESQSDKLIGFAPKILLVKMGLVNGFDLSKECIQNYVLILIPSVLSSSAGSSSTYLVFLRNPVAPAGSAVTGKEQDVEIE